MLTVVVGYIMYMVYDADIVINRKVATLRKISVYTHVSNLTRRGRHNKDIFLKTPSRISRPRTWDACITARQSGRQSMRHVTFSTQALFRRLLFCGLTTAPTRQTQTFTKCWFNVGRRRRRWPSIKLALGQCIPLTKHTENTKQSASFGLTFAHRLRRWPNFKPTLHPILEYIYSIYIIHYPNTHAILSQRWIIVVQLFTTVAQHWLNFFSLLWYCDITPHTSFLEPAIYMIYMI